MLHAQLTASYAKYTITQLTELDSNDPIIPYQELIVIRATETCFNKPPFFGTIETYRSRGNPISMLLSPALANEQEWLFHLHQCQDVCFVTYLLAKVNNKESPIIVDVFQAVHVYWNLLVWQQPWQQRPQTVGDVGTSERIRTALFEHAADNDRTE